MAEALPRQQPALTGNTMDMTPPEEIGFDYGQGEVLPPVQPSPMSPQERRDNLMLDFERGLRVISNDLDERLGGDPVEMDIDSQIYGFIEGGRGEGLGQWGYKDEIYQRALGYVPLDPNAIDAEEKKAVDTYVKQLKGQMLQEKQAKIALKQKYINQWIDMFKQSLRDEQNRREIEDVQAKRQARAKEIAAKEEAQKTAKEKKAKEKETATKEKKVTAEKNRVQKKIDQTRSPNFLKVAENRAKSKDVDWEIKSDHEKVLAVRRQLESQIKRLFSGQKVVRAIDENTGIVGWYLQDGTLILEDNL